VASPSSAMIAQIIARVGAITEIESAVRRACSSVRDTNNDPRVAVSNALMGVVSEISVTRAPPCVATPVKLVSRSMGPFVVPVSTMVRCGDS
jgi:hypothetical protein